MAMSPSKATGASKKLVPRRPALGLSVAQPNPSVANFPGSLRKRINQIAVTLAARRYKQMTASQKNGDVSVAVP
jgi:hypothetical protein